MSSDLLESFASGEELLAVERSARGSAFVALGASIFLSDLCHFVLGNTSEGLVPRLFPLERPSVGAMEPLFVSGRMLPLLWLEKRVGISIMSSMCVRLSHRKLHDGECLTFLYADTSIGVTHGCVLSFAAMQQLAPILLKERELIFSQFYHWVRCSEFIHAIQPHAA